MWERHEIKNINSTEQDLIYEIKIGDVVFDVVYLLRVYNNFNNQWIDYDGVTELQKQNRLLLQSVMKKFGFKPLKEEWWHFTLHNETFPDTYFNFLIE